jgi:hypothetical protein
LDREAFLGQSSQQAPGQAAPDPAAELRSDTGQTAFSTLSPEDASAAIGGIGVNEPEGIAGAAGVAGGPPADVRRVVSKDEFFGVFQAAHVAGAMAGVVVTKDPAWRALIVQENEMVEARKCADALYRLAELYPSVLGWLIAPPGETMACAIAIGGYGFAVVTKVRKAREARHSRPAQPQQPQQQDASP